MESDPASGSTGNGRRRQADGEGGALPLAVARRAGSCRRASRRCCGRSRGRARGRRARGSTRVSAWRKRSKMNGRNSGGMPRPVSVTAISMPPPEIGPDRHVHRSPRRCELDRVGQQVPEHLLQAIGIGLDRLDRRGRPTRPGGRLCARRPAPPSRARRRPAGGRPRPRSVSFSLPGDDPRDVEDVLDDLGQRARVALDHLERGVALLLADGAGAEHARVAEDRVERRAQLVRQGREELVLQVVGAPRLFVGPGVLDRDRRAVGDGLRELEIGLRCSAAPTPPTRTSSRRPPPGACGAARP